MTTLDGNYPGAIIIDGIYHQRGSLQAVTDATAQTVRIVHPYNPQAPIVNTSHFSQYQKYLAEPDTYVVFEDFSKLLQFVQQNFFFS